MGRRGEKRGGLTEIGSHVDGPENLDAEILLNFADDFDVGFGEVSVLLVEREAS